MTRNAGDTFVYNNDVLKVVDVSNRIDKWDCDGCYFKDNNIDCISLDTWRKRGNCISEDEVKAFRFIKVGDII